MSFPQRLLADDESLVLVLRRHWKVLAGPFAVLLLAVVAVAIPAALTDGGGWPTWLWVVIAVIAAVVLLRWFLWPLVVWRTTVYAITTRRLILREGVFARSGHDMPLSRLNDVSFSHTFVERMLGCGSLVVESAGERGQLTLNDIPKVELVQRTLYRLSESLNPRPGNRPIDPDLAQQLDDEFDDEYRGPPSSGSSGSSGSSKTSPTQELPQEPDR